MRPTFRKAEVVEEKGLLGVTTESGYPGVDTISKEEELADGES